MIPDTSQMEAYIRQAAVRFGIDPDIAVKVARAEGLKPGVWQSNVVKNGQREPSYGPFQLFMGGGLGNQMQAATGLDPSDPANWQQGIDYALKSAASGGWGPWYGAKAVGITGMEGIGGRPDVPLQNYGFVNPATKPAPAEDPGILDLVKSWAMGTKSPSQEPKGGSQSPFSGMGDAGSALSAMAAPPQIQPMAPMQEVQRPEPPSFQAKAWGLNKGQDPRLAILLQMLGAQS